MQAPAPKGIPPDEAPKPVPTILSYSRPQDNRQFHGSVGNMNRPFTNNALAPNNFNQYGPGPPNFTPNFIPRGPSPNFQCNSRTMQSGPIGNQANQGFLGANLPMHQYPPAFNITTPNMNQPQSFPRQSLYRPHINQGQRYHNPLGPPLLENPGIQQSHTYKSPLGPPLGASTTIRFPLGHGKRTTSKYSATKHDYAHDRTSRPRRNEKSRSRSSSRNSSPRLVHRKTNSRRRDNTASLPDAKRHKRDRSPEIFFDPVTNDMAVAEKKATEETETDVPDWVRSSPADLYFKKDRKSGNLMATKKMEAIEDKFEADLIERASRIREAKPKYKGPRLKPWESLHKHKHHHCGDSDSSSSSSDSEEDLDDLCLEENEAELRRKQEHPERLHCELWFNEKFMVNDGPLCRCSQKARKTGIRHYIYPGEVPPAACNASSNNVDRLYHYRVTIQPLVNVITKRPTVIEYDGHKYTFEGFSLFTHEPFENIPPCHFIRFNVEYTVDLLEEDMPENFSTKSLDLVSKYIMLEIMELYDLDWLLPKEEGKCPLLHMMLRFARPLPENGKELLSINEIMRYMLHNNKPLLELTEIGTLLQTDQRQWQDYVDHIQGSIVTYPGMRPSSIRIDQLDKTQTKDDVITYPLIIHFGTKPLQLSYLQNKNYRTAWKDYTKLKHLLANKPRVSQSDKTKLLEKEETISRLRLDSELKREVTTEISSEGFYRTGINADICQFALMVPVLIEHLRFHKCLAKLENDHLKYTFKDKSLLHLALTHPSHRVHYGTNADHVRNSISNVGIRNLDYGDRRVQTINYRKKGVVTLMNIMATMGEEQETRSRINHNERLEFLGDAVLEFLTSVHLYYMFPNLEEGGLATYRSALVKNRHLAVLGKKLHLEEFLLYSHGPDICRESEIRHAVSNCFEAILAAVFLDAGNIEEADKIFAGVMFDKEDDLYNVWASLPLHPLQIEEADGDRHWIELSPALQNLTVFEERTGIEFDHIRLLARSFTMRSVGFSNLTKGNNQRMEFLGDTILNIICTEYLFKHFPKHHEGHLSLLRSALVNNRTQATVYDDMGLSEYVIHRHRDVHNLKQKERADVVEALLGALYVDKNLEYCKVFCQAVFFPRLREFIMSQDWNDPKSKLQQCCLTLRNLSGTGEPDIPIYRTLSCGGPTNTRKYKVAVYFRGERLGIGRDQSIQKAQMKAAEVALEENKDLFPQLAYQKHLIDMKYRGKEEYKKWKEGREEVDINKAAEIHREIKEITGEHVPKSSTEKQKNIERYDEPAYKHSKKWIETSRVHDGRFIKPLQTHKPTESATKMLQSGTRRVANNIEILPVSPDAMKKISCAAAISSAAAIEAATEETATSASTVQELHNQTDKIEVDSLPIVPQTLFHACKEVVIKDEVQEKTKSDDIHDN